MRQRSHNSSGVSVRCRSLYNTRLHVLCRKGRVKPHRPPQSRPTCGHRRLHDTGAAFGGDCVDGAPNGKLTADEFEAVVEPRRARHPLTRARRKSEQFA
jgi:hypothetical protein